MTTCRLIYKSAAHEATLANEALADLQRIATEKNSRLGITGMLILSGDRFLQVLEGDSDKVNQLYARIIADQRHHDVELISYEAIAQRFFDIWAMRLIDLYDLPLQPRQFLMKKYESEDGVVRIPDQINLVYSLLLDAKLFCLSEPWSLEPAG